MPVSTDFEKERLEVQAVIESGIFERSPGLANFLKYIAEMYFQGRSGDIKEYSIATEALGRGPDFDKRKASIVRVEAHRLRKRLKEYYADAGADHEIQISLVPGHYVPDFIVMPSPEAPAKRPAKTPFWTPRRRRIFLMHVAGTAIAVSAFFFFRNPSRPARTDAPAQLEARDEVRILAGYSKEKYIDRLGNVWSHDAGFNGGTAVELPAQFVARSPDPTYFQTMRTGADFSYDIPLRPENYELRLYFAELNYGPGTNAGGGEGSRVFRVQANDSVILPAFDVAAESGTGIAHVRTFRNIAPGRDGRLHLKFSSIRDHPFVNAIEILPAHDRRAIPVRIVARDYSYTDRAGRIWAPDRYFLGGVHQSSQVTGPPEAELYRTGRVGNFSYAIPLPPGRYEATLHFAAISRPFHVYTAGTTLLRNFEPGAGCVQKTFHNLSPDAQGKLMLSFVPARDYALVNAIEVVEEE